MLWNSVDEVVLFKTEYRFVTPFVYELAATNQFMKFLLGHRLPSSFCETYDDCETFYQLHEAVLCLDRMFLDRVWIANPLAI